MPRLNSHSIRRLADDSLSFSRKVNDFYLILDNVLDTYNIGGLFRLAEASGIKRLFICGEHALTPPHHRIHKASIGTHRLVPWDYSPSATGVINKLRSEVPNLQVVALEQSSQSKNILESDYQLPLALVLGNETTGASEQTLMACDQHVEIPMLGHNISMNVIVSAGIAIFEINRKCGIYE